MGEREDQVVIGKWEQQQFTLSSLLQPPFVSKFSSKRALLKSKKLPGAKDISGRLHEGLDTTLTWVADYAYQNLPTCDEIMKFYLSWVIDAVNLSESDRVKLKFSNMYM